MVTPVVTVPAAAPAREGIALMKEKKIRHLPVVDGRGRLAGIVTDRDLRQAMFHPAVLEAAPDLGTPPPALTVDDLMTCGVITVRPETEIRQAVRLMYERKIGALPVVAGDRVVGILTEADLLRALEALLRARVTTVRPLGDGPGDADAYDYGFPLPQWGELWEEGGQN